MNYKDKIYSSYNTKYTVPFYGETTLATIQTQFPIWNKYYGIHLPKDKGIKILEIGCGNGGFLFYLESSGYTDHLGIDVSDEQIAATKKLGIKKAIKADLKEFLNDKESIYDVIVARDVLEHFEKDEMLDILSRIHKALKPGGRLIAQCPNAESPFFGRIRYGDFTHDVAFTKSSLLQLALCTGFSKIDCYPTGPVVRNVKSFIKACVWKIAESVFKIYIPDGIFTLNIIAVIKK